MCFLDEKIRAETTRPGAYILLTSNFDVILHRTWYASSLITFTQLVRVLLRANCSNNGTHYTSSLSIDKYSLSDNFVQITWKIRLERIGRLMKNNPWNGRVFLVSRVFARNGRSSVQEWNLEDRKEYRRTNLRSHRTFSFVTVACITIHPKLIELVNETRELRIKTPPRDYWELKSEVCNFLTEMKIKINICCWRAMLFHTFVQPLFLLQPLFEHFSWKIQIRKILSIHWFFQSSQTLCGNC